MLSPKGEHDVLRSSLSPQITSVVSAILYASSSVMIMLFNKSVLSIYGFKYPDVLALLHMTTCLFGLLGLRKFGFLSFRGIDFSTAKQSAPVALAFVGNIVIGLSALSTINVSMFTTLRRLTALLIIAMEYKLANVIPSRGSISAVAIMLFGSFFAAIGDLEFNLLSYSTVLANNVATATYLVGIKRLNKRLQLDSWSTFYYNSALSTPLLLCVCLVRGSLFKALHFSFLGDINFQVSITLSAVLSFFLNFATFWCTTANTALTTSVVGQLKNILTTVISILVLEGGSTSFTGGIGLAISIAGSIVYSYVKYSESQLNKQQTYQTLTLPIEEEVPKTKSPKSIASA